VACGLLSPPGAEAQAPDETWRTLRTEHFRVTFPAALEALGARAADRAERAWGQLAASFVEPPEGVIDLLVTDHADISNGFAQVTPSNRITIFARPPVDGMSIGHTDEWLELVITHELAHIVHLDHVANPVGEAARSVFGRVNLDWPFFPQLATPRWVIEGLATWYESRLTGAGRVQGSFLDMQIRTAVLEGRFENIGQASGDSPLWPGGNRAYAYGSLFLDYLLDNYGEDRVVAFVDAVGRQWIPYRVDAAGREAFGISLTDAWDAWAETLRDQLADLDARLSADAPITEAERLTFGARWGLYPTVSPDGTVLAHVRSDGRSDTQIRLRDVARGNARTLGRTNGVSTFSWTPDGALIVAQLELSGPYRVYGDLYRFDRSGAEHRLTRGARLDQPSVAPDGRRVVAVQQGDGATALVLVDLEDGSLTQFVAAEPDVLWAFPRWSPDGRWIAATRWEPNAYHDVVILDGETGRVVERLTRDRALDLAPAWSPDGRWLVWSSDRSGVFNILGAPVDPSTGAAGSPVLLTNVRTGAAFPSVDPSGSWLYFSGYHADGWEVERVPFAPTRATAAQPAVARFDPTRPTVARGAIQEASEPYSAMPTLWPTYWEVAYSSPLATPEVSRDSTYLRRRELLGFGLGLRTSGTDLVGRHTWGAVGRLTTQKVRFEGGFDYVYRGLGSPVLSVSTRQEYRDGGQFAVAPAGDSAGLAPPDTLILLQRDRIVDGAVTLLAPRWRRTLSLTLRTGLRWERRELFDQRLNPSREYRLGRPTRRFAEYGASVNFSSQRTHAFQMGAARGLSAFVFAGFTDELALPDSLARVRGADGGFGETLARVRAAVPLWGGGYARHVLAVQASGGIARGPGAGALQYRVGGASGESESLTGFGLFGGSFVFFPVRGYPTSSRYGHNAWSVSADYRFPLVLLNRGLGAWPVHVDRAIASIFFDAGNAWGPDVTDAGNDNAMRTPLASAGAEVTTEILGLYSVPLRLRLGFGIPLLEMPGAQGPQGWLRVGLPF
jgi:hypothetical protein